MIPDPFVLALWGLRIAFLVLLWVILVAVARIVLRDLRRTVRAAPEAVGRIIVLASPRGSPVQGTTVAIGAVASFGRDPSATIHVDDPSLDAGPAILAWRGEAWSLAVPEGAEGIRVAGHPVEASASVTVGDEIAFGAVRVRVELAGDEPG
ncbi:MAG: hypothetical protein ACKOTZ_09245 [Chloroflexota bacterium]